MAAAAGVALTKVKCRSRIYVPPTRPNACLRSFLFPIRAELLEIGPETIDFLFILDAGEDHLGARNLGARVLDVVLEGRLAPYDAGDLVGVGIAEAGRAAGMAAVEAVRS